jgi:2-keto-4-pentenoate hydratase
VRLSCNGEHVDRGTGADVLGSPAYALAYLTRVIAGQPGGRSVTAGEIITTGTITSMWPVTARQTWTSSYGTLPVDGLAVSFR